MTLNRSTKRVMIVLACVFIIQWLVFLCVKCALAADYVTHDIYSAPVTGTEWSNPLAPMYKNEGEVNISVEGSTMVGTVTLQRKFGNDATWYDVDTWTASSQQKFKDTEHGVRYRIGVKQADYTSGNIKLRLSK